MPEQLLAFKSIRGRRRCLDAVLDQLNPADGRGRRHRQTLFGH